MSLSTLGTHVSHFRTCLDYGGNSRCLGLGSRLCLGGTWLARLLGLSGRIALVGARCRGRRYRLAAINMPVAAVVHHIRHDFGYLFLQLADKLCRVVFMMLNVAQLLLPDTRQLSAGEQTFVYGVDELRARGRGHQVLALPADIVTLEQGLDDTGP